jgi:L-rhamnose isomerase/sugar isomerase
MGSEAAVREAFEQDVTAFLISVREDMGASADPMQAYAESGYQEKIVSRGIGGAGW